MDHRHTLQLRGQLEQWTRPRCLLLAAGVTALLPCCTLWGTAVGARIDVQTPGPYEFQPFQSASGSDPSTDLSGRYDLKKGDRLQLRLANGTTLTGRYAGVEAPSATQPESHLRLESEREHRRDTPTVTSIATSEIREIGVEVSGYGWAYGALAGLALDVAVIAILLPHSQ